MLAGVVVCAYSVDGDKKVYARAPKALREVSMDGDELAVDESLNEGDRASSRPVGSAGICSVKRMKPIRSEPAWETYAAVCGPMLGTGWIER